jgi:(4S)-4-hydroxy-5-phosphonooxypentane-2,3-dione isomerase
VYQLLVSFTVAPQHHDTFVTAALRNARDSVANEPGTRRFEVVAAQDDPNVFYLNEVYDDADACDVHVGGPHFAEFATTVTPIAQGPVWLMRGRPIEDRRP